jgi:N-acetylglucosaminyldiphosphoundecaprenol N-acetyl-beta-D-mannosaminyltransferase
MAGNTDIFGLAFSKATKAQLVAALSEPVRHSNGPRTVLTANVDHIVKLARNAEFRDSYRAAWIVTADGMPVYLYARWRGTGVPSRLTGADLFRDLMHALSPGQHRCFFVASTESTMDKLAAFLMRRGFSQESIAGDVPPMGFEHNADYSNFLALRILRHHTTHLFMGVGAPKSEIWINKHRETLGNCYVLHVGAGLDFFVGNVSRAPVWIQNCGFEWLWRVAQEPRRLFRRYLDDAWRFPIVILQDLLKRST